MGNAATIQKREKKGGVRFRLPVPDVNEDHLAAQRKAVENALATKMMARRWRKQARQTADEGTARGMPHRPPGPTDHMAPEQYATGVRTSVFGGGGRLRALTKLGDYAIRKKLGEGSFAQVKLAEHIPTGQKVAIKLFDKTKKLSEYELKHFYREATVLQRVQSVHCAAAFQFLDAEFVYALVFELIETDLLTDITRNGPYRQSKARSTIRQVIAGIEAVHAADLVHRDLKLENIGIDFKGGIKLLDFGLAGDIRGKDALETQCGTMVYSAPELLGDAPYGKQVDIWSIGIVLYSLLYACLPYDDGTRRNRSLTQLHAMMLDHEYQLPDTAPDSLKQLFHKLLEVKPHRRITCDGLWKEPWIVDEKEGGDRLPAISLADTSTVVTNDNIDMDVAKNVADRANISVAACKASVLLNRCDPLCGAYHMWARRKADIAAGVIDDTPLPDVLPALQTDSFKRSSRIGSIRSVFKRTGSNGSKKNKKGDRTKQGGAPKGSTLARAQRKQQSPVKLRTPAQRPSPGTRVIKRRQVTPQ
mmetsp:Transcript_3718/g.9334  ORF Transcript_3718/g.9334 Transcript_3718/m.9334 type:complete len:532 (+) Transcript_3718:177-1772(+)